MASSFLGGFLMEFDDVHIHGNNRNSQHLRCGFRSCTITGDHAAGLWFSLHSVGNLILPSTLAKLGRRPTYLVCNLAGACGGALMTLGCFIRSFSLVCLGVCFGGIAQAAGQNYRFAVMELAPNSKERAAGWVLSAGVLGSLLGGGGLAGAKDLLSAEFAGVFFLATGVHLLAFCVTASVEYPSKDRGLVSDGDTPPRPLFRILGQPLCLAAVVGNCFAWAMMMLIMAPTPIVMRDQMGHSFRSASLVMTVHAALMFAPSPVTASLILRFGPVAIIFAGIILNGACGLALIAGSTLAHFYLALAALGVAWNFGFFGATALLARTYGQNEGPKMQACSDALAALFTCTSTVLAAQIVEALEWNGAIILKLSLAATTFLMVLTLWLLSLKIRS